MRLHTRLTRTEVVNCLIQAQDAGHVSQRIEFDKLEEHGSRTHTRRIDATLYSYVRDAQHKHRTNSGWYGAGMSGGPAYAATWDEWGYFLAEIFDADPEAKTDYYASGADFDRQTEFKFAKEA